MNQLLFSFAGNVPFWSKSIFSQGNKQTQAVTTIGNMEDEKGTWSHLLPINLHTFQNCLTTWWLNLWREKKQKLEETYETSSGKIDQEEEVYLTRKSLQWSERSFHSCSPVHSILSTLCTTPERWILSSLPLADCPAMSYIFVCWHTNKNPIANKLSWPINYVASKTNHKTKQLLCGLSTYCLLYRKAILGTQVR